MQLQTRKYLDRIDAVDGFLDPRAAFLATWPKVGQFRQRLSAAQAAIIAAATAQAAQGGSGTSQVGLKQTLLDALIEDLRAMTRTAKQIDAEIPGTSSNFVYPASEAELSVIGAARVFLEKASAAALKDEFIGYGLPADFLEDLDHDIDLYDEFVTAQTGAEQGAALALKNLDDAIAQSSAVVDQLDALIRNVYLKNPTETESWKEAKRLRDVKAHRETPEAKARKAAKASAKAAV